MRAQEYEAIRTEACPAPRNIKPTNFRGISESLRKKKDNRRLERLVTQTVHGWMYGDGKI